MHIFQKIIKILVYIALGIFIIVAILEVFVDPFVKKTLVEQVSKAGNGQYTLVLDDLEVSLFKGDIVLKGVKLDTDTSHHFPATVLFTEAEIISLKGFSVVSWLLNNALVFDEVGGGNVRIEFALHPKGKAKQEKETFNIKQLDIYPLIEDKFDRIQVNKIAFENVSLNFINDSQSEKLTFDFQDLAISINDLLIDEGMLFTPSRSFYSEGIEISGKEIKFKDESNSNINITLDFFNFDGHTNKVGLELRSVKFLKTFVAHDTLFYFQLQDFNVENLEMEKIQNEGLAELEGIYMNGVDFTFAPDTLENKPGAVKQGNLDVDPGIKNFSIGLYLPDFLKKVSLEKLKIAEVSGVQKDVLKIINANIEGEKLIIDESPAFSNNRFFHFKNLSSKVGLLKITSGAPQHEATLKNFSLQAGNKFAHAGLENFLLLPKERSQNNKWVKIETDAISLDSLFTENIPSGELHLGKITIHRPRLEASTPYQPAAKQEKPESSGKLLELNEIEISPIINEYIGKFSISHFLIRDMSLEIFSQQKYGSLNISSPQINLQAHDIVLGPEKVFTQNSSLYSNQLDLSITDLSVEQKGKSSWKANFGSFNPILQRNIANLSIESFSFYQQQENQGDTLFSARLGQFSLNQLNVFRLLRNNEAALNTIALQDLQIFHNNDSMGAEGGEKSSKDLTAGNNKYLLSGLDLANYLPDELRQLKINNFTIQNVGLWQKNHQLLLENGNLIVRDLNIGERSAFAENRFLHSRQWKSSFENLNFLAGEGSIKQKVKLEKFRFEMEKGIGTLNLQHIFSGTINKNEDSLWAEAAINHFKLEGIDTRKLPYGALLIGEMAITDPTVVFHTSPKPVDTTTTSTQKPAEFPDLHPLIQDYLNELSVLKIKLKEGDFRFSGLGESYYGLHLPKVNVIVDDIHIAPGTAYGNGKLLHSTKILMDIEDMLYLFPDKVYSLQLEKAIINTSTKNLSIDNFRYAFSDNYKQKLQQIGTNEVYRIQNNSLEAEEVDFKNLISGNGFKSNKIIAGGLDIYVYKDFNVPYEEQEKPMPGNIVKNIKFPIAVKQLRLNKMEVIYEEMKSGADTAGYVNLTELEATIHNFTNVDSILKRIPSMDIAASGKLMDRGYFHSKINVPLLDLNKKIRVTGSMDTLDVTELNRIVQYNSRIALASGRFYKVNWDFEAGNDLSTGSVSMSYDDLKVQLSQPNSPDTTGIIKDIGSFFINKLVIDSNIAEGKNEKPKPASFEKKRDKERSFFHFYVQSLLAGFIEIIGIPFQ